MTSEEIKEWIRPVSDPELGWSIVDLGLVYDCHQLAPDSVDVKMTLTSAFCPAGDAILQQVKDRLLEHPEIKEAKAEIVWEPKWDPKTMASDEVREKMGLW